MIEIDPTPVRSRSLAMKSPVSRKRGRSLVDQSPSKKRRLEQDGVVLLDGQDDQMMDDVIVIDD